MKNISTNTIEKALLTYKETVSPSKHSFQVILSHIPEQQKQKRRRVVRSPYMWLSITQVVMLCSLLFVMISAINQPVYQSNPFYQIDKQVDDFEASINQEDYEKSLLDNSGL